MSKILQQCCLLPAQYYTRSAIFEITSGAIQVTDPCYEPDTWCAGSIENALNGKWVGQAFKHIEEVEEPYRWSVRRLDAALMFVNCLEAGLSYDDKTVLSDQQTKYKMSDESIKLISNGTLTSLEQFKELNSWFYSIDDVIENKVDLVEPAERTRFFMFESELNSYFGSLEYNRHYTGRPFLIQIAHESIGLQTNFDGYEYVDIDVGVDSGQAGFFDKAAYHDVYRDEISSEEFYDNICSQNLDGPHIGGQTLYNDFSSTPFGVSSSTYYGDGSYDCYVKRNDQNQVIAAVIIFMYAEDPDYEDEE